MNHFFAFLGVGGSPKPIEVLSHDPLRYVGDMLAWIHQAMATERELLQTLLKLCPPEGLFFLSLVSMCFLLIICFQLLGIIVPWFLVKFRKLYVVHSR